MLLLRLIRIRANKLALGAVCLSPRQDCPAPTLVLYSRGCEVYGFGAVAGVKFLEDILGMFVDGGFRDG